MRQAIAVKSELFMATKGCPTRRRPLPPKHQSTWNYTYTNTLTPTVILPAAWTELQTTFSIGLEPQNGWFQKKAQKCGNTGSTCLEKPV